MKKKSIIILSLSLLVVTLVSYIAFAEKDTGENKNPIEYGLFASERIQIKGVGRLNGDVWANDFLGLFGAQFEITGNTWSKNDISETANIQDPDGTWWQNTAQPKSENQHHHDGKLRKEMPLMMDMLKENFKIDGNYSEIGENVEGKRKDLNFKDLTPEELALEKSYIVSGNIVVELKDKQALKTHLNNNLIAEGDIKINLANYKADANNMQDIDNIKPVIIASNGNITIEGNPVIVGTVYAPNGTVTIAGSGNYIVGNVIAKNIIVSGSGLYINDDKKITFKEDL